MNKKMRKHLSASGLLESIRISFSYIKDPRDKSASYKLKDCLMSGLAVFGLKSPSLLDFDEKRKDKIICHNLKTLYGVEQVPCDTYLRERLDEVEPSKLCRAYKSGFRAVQRGKALSLFEFMDGYYLLSNDGTGIFNSEKIHCQNCCVKHHKDGSVSYYHQVMSSVLVHPEQSIVLPMLMEPILKNDGDKKNDCEKNAGKRLLTSLRAMHSQLKMIVVEDGLHSNAPHIRLLNSLNYRYLIGAKPADHKWLFDWVNTSKCEELSIKREGTEHCFKWINDVPLNESNEDIRVNFMEYWEIGEKGKIQHFTWITDIKVTKENIYKLMRGARARWRIENETFNTLKNQGYNFEHNFGHGYNNLSTVFAHLMMLAFMVDQMQQLCCPLFQKALTVCLKKRRLWETMRHYFYHCLVDCWEALFQSVVNPPEVRLSVNTS
jgi:hypothetical protein